MLKQFVTTLLDDHDRDAAALILVVGVTAERPVRRAAGDIRKSGTQVQEAAQVHAAHTCRYAAHPVRRAVVCPNDALRVRVASALAILFFTALSCSSHS